MVWCWWRWMAGGSGGMGMVGDCQQQQWQPEITKEYYKAIETSICLMKTYIRVRMHASTYYIAHVMNYRICNTHAHIHTHSIIIIILQWMGDELQTLLYTSRNNATHLVSFVRLNGMEKRRWHTHTHTQHKQHKIATWCPWMLL